MSRLQNKILAATGIFAATCSPANHAQKDHAAAAVDMVPADAVAAAVPPTAAAQLTAPAAPPVPPPCPSAIPTNVVAIAHPTPPLAAVQVQHPRAIAPPAMAGLHHVPVVVPPPAFLAHRPPAISQAALAAISANVASQASPPEEPCIPRDSPTQAASGLEPVNLPLDPPPPSPPHCEGSICSTQQGVIVPSLYVVINNSNKGFYCATQWAGSSEWSGWFKMMPGKEWNADSPPKPKNAAIQCTAPVRHWIYTIQPGKRYTVQRGDDGLIQVREVTVNM
jgi:hypothetical protein